MHSPYETAGVKDTAYMIKACDTFLHLLFVQGDGVYKENSIDDADFKNRSLELKD